MKFVSITALSLVALVSASNWATYPSVPHTASVNGFADMVNLALPECASECADISTSNTPCPYWDTGCLCVMPQWSGQVASCIAESCTGTDVASATSACLSVCSSVGANMWLMPASLSTELSEAAAETGSGSVQASSTAFTLSLSQSTVSAGTTQLSGNTTLTANGTLSASSTSTADDSSSSSSSNGGSLQQSAGILGALIAVGVFMLH